MMEGEAPTQERVFQVKIEKLTFYQLKICIFVKYLHTGVFGSQTVELELQMSVIRISLFSAFDLITIKT